MPEAAYLFKLVQCFTIYVSLQLVQRTPDNVLKAETLWDRDKSGTLLNLLVVLYCMNKRLTA